MKICNAYAYVHKERGASGRGQFGWSTHMVPGKTAAS